MAEFTPTPAQAAAIGCRGRSLLVSAAAGSGKTRVLTERLLARLTDPDDPADIRDFLIITYTKAAAAELRTRIFRALTARAAEHPEDHRLRRQANLCLRAQIGTIHSCCASLLRENSRLLSLPPDFRVCEEEKAQALRQLTLERVLEAAYEDLSEPGLRQLIDTVGAGRDDRRLAELMLSLHARLRSHYDGAAWAGRIAGQMERAGAVADTVWGRELLGQAAADARFWLDELQALLDALDEEDGPVKKAYAASIAGTRASLERYAQALARGWDAAREACLIEFPRLGSLRKPPDADFGAQIKRRRDACKKACERFPELFFEPEAVLLEDMAKAAPAMRALLRLTMEFDRVYAAEKRRRGLLDFSDLEHEAARLLVTPDGQRTPTALAQAARWREIMVDEYQDVSRLQDLLCRAMSKNGENLFFVGDVKQSIYRFRLADPTVFLEKYMAFSDVEDAELPPLPPGPEQSGVPEADGGGRILLRENFRSRGAVLDAANQVFSCIMSRALGELDYDEAAALRCGVPAAAGGSVPELILLALDGDDEDDTPDKYTLEAEWVARQIRTLVETGSVSVRGGDGERPAAYSDVAILLRSANAAAPAYRRALEKYGVPLASGPAGGFFASTEITVMLSLLAVIDNPHQDVPLISVLRSPFFGFTADELADVRAGCRDGDFYTALCRRGETDEKCRVFLDTLAALRRDAPDMETGDFVRHVCRTLQLEALCTAMRAGAARRANLALLTECAERFAAGGGRGLRRFVEWLRRMAERGEEPSGGTDAGGVRIMSVHRSKGLEFPIVFVCDLARRFNTGDLRASVLVHPELGLGPRAVDEERGVEYPTLARRAIEERLRRELLSEEMRVLYVAMTRARDRLYLTAAVKNPEKKVETLQNGGPAAPQLLRRASSPVDWLIRAAGAGQALRLRIVPDAASDGALPEAEAEETAAQDVPAEAVAALRERLEYVYPHAAAQALPSKLTATGIRALAEPPDGVPLEPGCVPSFELPDFLRAQRPASAAERGTAAHRLLQCMDLARGVREGAAAERDRLLASRRLTAREAQIADLAAVDRFLASPLCARILAADRVERELRFSVLCPASVFFPDGPEDEVLLQGVVDCCIEERGRLTVIDYKTDRVRGAALQARAREYAAQVRAYALAMTRLTGLPVRETVLYFLAAGQAVTLEAEDAPGARL